MLTFLKNKFSKIEFGVEKLPTRDDNASVFFKTLLMMPCSLFVRTVITGLSLLS